MEMNDMNGLILALFPPIIFPRVRSQAAEMLDNWPVL
jgi:hypothetical protein